MFQETTGVFHKVVILVRGPDQVGISMEILLIKLETSVSFMGLEPSVALSLDTSLAPRNGRLHSTYLMDESVEFSAG